MCELLFVKELWKSYSAFMNIVVAMRFVVF